MLLSLTSLNFPSRRARFCSGARPASRPSLSATVGMSDAIPTHVANVHIIIMHATTTRFFRYTLALWWDTPLVVLVLLGVVVVMYVFPPLAWVVSSSKSSSKSSSSFFFSREKDDVNEPDVCCASSKLWCSSCRRDVLEANPAKHGCDERPSLGNLGMSLCRRRCFTPEHAAKIRTSCRCRGAKGAEGIRALRAALSLCMWMPRIGIFWIFEETLK